MTLSQDQLKAFYEVSKQQSFTKAASELGLTQSALSHRIKKLEEQLETTLLVRDPAGIRLTEAGTKLLEFCRMQAQMEAEILSDITGPSENQIKGFLRIGGASTLMWPAVVPALSDFISKNPAVQFEMMERELKELPDLLQTGRVDLIVTCGVVERMIFEGHYLGDEVNTLVESKKISARPNTYLDQDPNDQTTFNFLRHQGIKKPQMTRCYMNNIHGIISGVEAGLGKTVLPRHLLKDHKDLKAVSGQKELTTPVYLYTLKQPFYSKLHQAVIAELNKKVGSFLS